MDSTKVIKGEGILALIKDTPINVVEYKQMSWDEIWSMIQKQQEYHRQRAGKIQEDTDEFWKWVNETSIEQLDKELPNSSFTIDGGNTFINKQFVLTIKNYGK